MFSKTVLMNLILILSILFGLYYIRLQLTRPVNTSNLTHQPDSYATQVVMYHIDKAGILGDQLSAPFSLHYPSNNTTLLTAPLFTFYLKNKASWQLSARYGRLKENDRLRLWNNVTLEQKNSNNKIISTLKTSTLDIHIKEKIADTSAPVSITRMNQVIHAVGLHANFNTKTIRLLSQVKSQFMPEKSK